MSCPDWPAATAWRDGDGAAPPEWWADLEHLAGCASCRRRVAELDPTLLLAAAAAPAPETTGEDVDILSATVRSLVAAERLAARARPDRRALLVAAALVALLVMPLGLSRFARQPVAPGITPLSAGALVEPPAAAPPVEEVQPAAARVYQFGTEELPVVLIFDESLDL